MNCEICEMPAVAGLALCAPCSSFVVPMAAAGWARDENYFYAPGSPAIVNYSVAWDADSSDGWVVLLAGEDRPAPVAFSAAAIGLGPDGSALFATPIAALAAYVAALAVV